MLDENLPVPLKNDFSDTFDVVTVHDKGWRPRQNEELLQAIDGDCSQNGREEKLLIQLLN